MLWYTPLVPALRKQRWLDLFKASLVYREFQDNQGYTEKPCFITNKQIITIKKERRKEGRKERKKEGKKERKRKKERK